MAITWNMVSAFAVIERDVPTEEQTIILAHVNTALNVARWGGEDSPRLKLARILLAAHFGSVGFIGYGGAVTSESADGLSRSYAAPVAGAHAYAETRWGRDYLALVAGNSQLRGPTVSGGMPSGGWGW